MKTVIYESDHVYECVMPVIGKRFISGEEVVLTDEQAEIALTNSSIRLADDVPAPKAPVADTKVAPAAVAGAAAPASPPSSSAT